MNDAIAVIVANGLPIAGKALLALVILWVGMFVLKALRKGLRTAFERNPRIDMMLAAFFASIIYYFGLFILVVTALSTLGINMGAAMAAATAFVAAMGFALEGVLGNFAAGVMVMIFRPYKIGDEVELAGHKGVVKDINLVATVLHTRDNKEIIVGNGEATSGTIRNNSALGIRRLDMDFGIDFDTDVDTAIGVITGAVADDPRILSEPHGPWAKVITLKDRQLVLQLRIWVEFEDYRKIRMDISQKIKTALDTAGIGIPYPHVVKIRTHVPDSKSRPDGKPGKYAKYAKRSS